MHIKSALRFYPFTHLVGTPCLIPGTEWVCRVYPTLLRLSRGQEEIEHPLPLVGPVRPFTIFQDLEKGRVEVRGKAESGFFRFFLLAEESAIKLISLKGSLESKTLATAEELPLPPKERLSLGINKQQDWQMVLRRSDPTEILPFWLRLAAWTPGRPHELNENRGTYALLQKGEKTKQYALLKNAIEGCFEGMLTPRIDDGLLGLISFEKFPDDLSPLPLLHLGAGLIRSLFITFDEEEIALLPHLPPEFHAGRFLHITTPHGDTLSLEWSKKQLKKVHLKAATTRILNWKFPRALSSYRLRLGRATRGERLSTKEPLKIESGREYHLDRFEK